MSKLNAMVGVSSVVLWVFQYLEQSGRFARVLCARGHGLSVGGAAICAGAGDARRRRWRVYEPPGDAARRPPTTLLF